MPKEALIVYLDPEDRRKLEEQAKEEASNPSAIARTILHKALSAR